MFVSNTTTEVKNNKRQKLVYAKPLMIFVYVILPFTIGFAIGNKFILPFLTAIPASIVLINHLRKSELRYAVIDMILYVFWLTVVGLILMTFWFERSNSVILNGASYIEEMRPWLKGEFSKEGTPSKFIPEHMLHFVVVAIGSFLTGGFLALFFGTILMNYMNMYVAWLMTMSDKPILLAIIGWHPWSVFRVISFIVLGVVCSSPLIYKFSGIKIDKRKFFYLILIAVILEVIDILLKTFIGPSWRDMLMSNINLQ